MIPIIDSIKYAWGKVKENMEISLFSTLLLLAVGTMTGGSGVGTSFLGMLATIFAVIIRIGYTKIFLKMEDGLKPKFSEIFDEYSLFWKYLGVSILTGLAVVLGLIFLIIPGLILAIRLSFAPLILIDSKTGPIKSMKESWALTRGHFWSLLGFWLTIAILNILGFIALGVGFLFTIPISSFASIHIYRAFSKANSEIKIAVV
jgi:uncharacterized membrane protein